MAHGRAERRRAREAKAWGTDALSPGYDFVCELWHVHDPTGLPGPKYDGAPCPNDPESPNAYPEEDL